MRTSTKVFSAGLLLAGLISRAQAQTDYTSTSSMPSSSVASSGGPVAPRTGEYPGSINGAADNTVDDYTKRGTLINGKQYFAGWGGATQANGAYSFQAIGFDWFGSVTTAVGPGNGTWRSGIATPKWAGGLLINFNKTTTKDAAGETKTVVAGDGFGLFGDFNLGSSDVYGEAALLTGPGNYVKTPATETTPTTIRIMAGWKKDATTEGTHALNAELTLNKSSIESGTPKVTEDIMSINFMFSHGYILKAGTGYSVFLGDNSVFTYSTDDVPATTADPDGMGISIAPNLVFHKDLGHNFEFTSGAAAALSYNTVSNASIAPPAPANQEGSRLLTGSANIDLGLRWVKDNFSIQGNLSEALLQAGPNFVSGATNPMFAQVGVSLGI
jgi:hypothetical protein